jgi:conjugative transfer signal peptidase TraF
MLLPFGITPNVRLIYNASESAPRGFYAVARSVHLRTGDYVVARLPEAVAKLAAQRDYLSRTVPVLKRIVALEGDRVCVRDGMVHVHETAAARVLRIDGQGRPLAAWNHCRHLVSGEVFLLNTYSPASFDSRYFGPLDVTFVRGRAVPLWTFGGP